MSNFDIIDCAKSAHLGKEDTMGWKWHDTVAAVIIICLITGLAAKLLMPVINAVFSGIIGDIVVYSLAMSLIALIGLCAYEMSNKSNG